MIQLLFLVLFAEGILAFLLLVKIGPLRELVIKSLDQLKTGKGPATVKTDDTEKITSKPYIPRTIEIAPAQQREEDLTESTGVVLAKYPPKVKLEPFSQLQSAREGK